MLNLAILRVIRKELFHVSNLEMKVAMTVGSDNNGRVVAIPIMMALPGHGRRVRS